MSAPKPYATSGPHRFPPTGLISWWSSSEPTRELVSRLIQRAQDHRLIGTVSGRQVELADGNTASVGDLVITRRNERSPFVAQCESLIIRSVVVIVWLARLSQGLPSLPEDDREHR
jgi:hypothetical protein